MKVRRGVLDHAHSNIGRERHPGFLQNRLGVGNQLCLERRIAPRPGNDLAEKCRLLMLRIAHEMILRANCSA